MSLAAGSIFPPTRRPRKRHLLLGLAGKHASICRSKMVQCSSYNLYYVKLCATHQMSIIIMLDYFGLLSIDYDASLLRCVTLNTDVDRHARAGLGGRVLAEQASAKAFELPLC